MAEYKEHIVAFIDILGFGQSLLENDPKFEDLLNTLKFIEEQSEPFTKRKEGEHGTLYRAGLRNFSDTIIVFSDSNECQFSTTAFTTVLMRARNIQQELLKLGFATRGGVSSGKLHDGKKNIFGEGIINAYAQENLAIYPRLVIDEKLITQQPAILDYPYTQRDFDYKLIVEPFVPITQSKEIREVIIKNIKKHQKNENIFSKWCYLAKHFNRCLADCQEKGDRNIEDILPIEIDNSL